ncbi:MAG: TOBE domain-containing protein [Eggerthellaceae bacterium]
MWISARNQLKGTVSHITDGMANGIVTIDLGTASVKADITMDAIDALDLHDGMTAFAVIKASNVMFAAGSEPIKNLSARNQLPGTIVAVIKGAVNGHVSIELDDGNVIMGSITNEAIEELGLAEGGKAVAIVKSTDVMVGTEE